MRFPKNFIQVVFLAVVFAAHLSLVAEGEEEWQEYRTRHFFIYYKDAPVDFVQNIEEAAENYYEEITDNLGFTRYDPWSYDERAKIYIYRDQDDYVNSAQQAGWSHGVANAQQKTIRTFPSAHGFFDSTLPHEMGHIVFREFIGFETSAPLWLDEGVAMFQEKAKRWGANSVVIKAMQNGKFISLPDLSRIVLRGDSDQDLIELYYAEAASAVYFLITEHGKHRFLDFCQGLQDGEPFEEALRLSYGRFDGIADLNKSWVSYLKEKANNK